MSCLGPFYNPVPPREWSRVQNQCTYLTGSPPTTINVPLLGITVPFNALAYQVALINKGNVLQYKKNSSNLTKNQRYSQIAKGMWTNRNTTWATQSDKYSNPNTQSLKRVGAETILVNGIPIPDGGNLLCNVTENPITGETVVQPANQNYHPTSDSDVPGRIQQLYWNERIQTWYPRQRYTMNNSTDKWPINSKAIFPVDGFTPPIIPEPTPDSGLVCTCDQ